MKFPSKHLSLAIVSALLTATAAAPAATRTWDGDTTINDDWHLNTNWSDDTLPVDSDVVRINSGTTELFPVVYSTGTVNLNNLSLGFDAGEVGYLNLTGGEITTNSGQSNIGGDGYGELTIENGGLLTKQIGGLEIGSGVTGVGVLNVETGGIFRVNSSNLNVFVGDEGSGTVNLHGGRWELDGNGVRVDVGRYNAGGTGVLDIRGGTMTAEDATSEYTLRVGYNGDQGDGSGTVQGYGTIDLRGDGNTGEFDLGGQVIADGSQVAGGTADSNLVFFYSNLDTVSNTPGSTHFGFYTSNQGGLDVPEVVIGNKGNGNIFWGDDVANGGDDASSWDPNDPSPSTDVMVNSVYAHVSSDMGSVDISLLDSTRTTDIDGTTLLTNDTGLTFMNIWQIEMVDLDGDPDTIIDTFSVRYDESFSVENSAAALGDPVAFYYWDGVSGSWMDLSDDTVVNVDKFLAQYTGSLTVAEGASGYFALAAVPEPTSAALLAGAGLLLLGRRRRRQ